MSSIQYKFALVTKKQTFYYNSYDEALKMARFCGLGMNAVKELHVF